MRKGSILAALALLALIAVPIADAAVSRPSMTVEGNFIGAFPDPSLTGFFRLEMRTTETGKVEFGYYQSDGMTGLSSGVRTEATVDSVKFFTDQATGAKGAEFTGTECVLADPTNPANVGFCNPYRIRVTDGGTKTDDTFCGGPVGGTCYVWVVTGGDIRIFQRQ